MRAFRPLLITILLATPAFAQIRWTRSFDAALAAAKTQNKVVFIARSMEGERASDEIAAGHYKDPAIVALSKHTINVFCSNAAGKKSADHRANDASVRREVLGVTDDSLVIAPQHLFVNGDGKIVHSAAHFITKGELEWLFVEAIRSIDAEFKWEPSERSRAPVALLKGTADKSKAEAPPSKDEVKRALDDIRKLGSGGGGRGRGRGRGGFGGIMKMLQSAQKNAKVLVRSDQKRAVDWGRNTLRSYRRFRNGLITDIGRVSPKVWAPVVEEWLEAESDATRAAAVVALESIANKKSATKLRKFVKKESDEKIQGRFFRAMAACAPTNGSVATTIKKAVKKHESETVRAHAVIAAGKLEKRAVITECLTTALQDDSSLVRQAAAYVIGIRQDKALFDALLSSLQAETDDIVKDWMEKARNTIKTGENKPLRPFLKDILGDEDAPSITDLVDEGRGVLEDLEKRRKDAEKKGDGKGGGVQIPSARGERVHAKRDDG